MAGPMHVKHPGVAWGDEALVQRLERETVARQPSRERRIGNPIQRYHNA
jgi:hypothetical protein